MIVDRRLHEPLHEQVRRAIFEEIVQGTYRPGDQLPTEREYAERLSVSLAPIRAALSQLVQSGHLERTQGRGTFVVDPKVQYALKLLSSSTDSLRMAGVDFSVKLLECEVAQASSALAAELRLLPKEKAVHLKRLVAIRGRPAILLESWLPGRFGGVVLADQSYYAAGGSLYRRLRDAEVVLAHSQGQLDMSRVTDVESQLLSLPFGHPLFDIQALVTAHDGQPIEKSRGRYDADRFALRLDRTL